MPKPSQPPRRPGCGFKIRERSSISFFYFFFFYKTSITCILYTQRSGCPLTAARKCGRIGPRNTERLSTLGYTGTHYMKKHIHKYVRVQLKFAKVWKCNLPNCTHWMPPHQEEVIKGRMSICWGCSEPFILEEQAMQDDQPKCFTCREPEEFTNILRDDALDDYLKRDKLG